MVRCFTLLQMDRFAIHDNDVTNFAVGIEVGGKRITAGEITGNRVRDNSGNRISCVAATTIVHRNDVSDASASR